MANLSDRVIGGKQFETSNPNFIINGGFDIWQRGIEFSVGRYSADRWWNDPNVSAFVLQSNIVPSDLATHSILIVVSEGATPNMYTSVELSNPSIGSAPFTPNTQYTLSFWATRQRLDPFRVQLSFVDAVGDATNRVVFFDGLTVAPNSLDYQQYVLTFNITTAVPNSTNRAMEIRILAEQGALFDNIMNIALVKLEEGTRATPFIRAGNTEAGELEMCQRYFQENFMGVGRTSPGGELARCYGSFPVSMRTFPTIDFHPDPGKTTRIDDIGGSIHFVDSLSIDVASPDFSNAFVTYLLTTPATGANTCNVDGEFSYLSLDAEL